MKSSRLFTLTILAPLALSACGDSATDDAPAEAIDGSAPASEAATFDGSAAVDNGEAYDEPAPENDVFDPSGTEETGVGAAPETGGTEPMDTAAPMDGTEPTAEGFGSNEG